MDRRTLLAFIIDATSQPQLDTPTNLTASGTTITFDEVENATSYEVFADGVSIGEYEVQMGETWVINEDWQPPSNDLFSNVLFLTDDTQGMEDYCFGEEIEDPQYNMYFCIYGVRHNEVEICGCSGEDEVIYRIDIGVYHNYLVGKKWFNYDQDIYDWSESTTYANSLNKTIHFATAPTGDLLTWLQANATLQPSTETVTIDLTALTGWESLSSGTHTITVKAKADGYKDSLASQGVSVTKPAEMLCFTAQEATDIVFVVNGTLTGSPSLQYKLNNGSWTEYTFGNTISLANGDKCYWKGNNSTFSEGTSKYIYFTSTGLVAASGNIMSIVDETLSSLTIPSNYFFCYLFKNCTSLTSAPDLPATTLISGCYYGMFSGCTSLTTAPDLPATTLAVGCYDGMFSGCTSLNNEFDLQHITSTSQSSLAFMLNNTGENSIIKLGTSLTSVAPVTFGLSGLTTPGTNKIILNFTNDDTPQFTLANIVTKGTSKATFTYYIYTDNTAIKDACLANADQYTIVNVYHLDGSEWGE